MRRKDPSRWNSPTDWLRGEAIGHSIPSRVTSTIALK